MWKKLRRVWRALLENKRKPILAKRPSVRLGLEALEERWCPAGVGGGGTVYTWDPPQDPANLFFSNQNDWQPQGNPGANDTVVFDGNVNQSDCILDSNQTVWGLTYQNGFNAALALGSTQGTTLTVTNGANLTNLSQNQVNITANIDFVDWRSTLVLSGNSNLSNFSFQGANGEVQLASGTLNIQTPAGGYASTAAYFQISGAINFQNSTSLSFTNEASLSIMLGGTANIQNPGTGVVDDNGGLGGIFKNWGTVNFTGAAGTITIVMMAFDNEGTMNLGGPGNLRFGSTSLVPGDPNYGFVMGSGQINLSQDVVLDLGVTGYHQTGGALCMPDASQVSLLAGTRGATIDGGVVQFTSPMGTGYGQLTFSGAVNWNGGTLNMRINGPQGSVVGGANNADLIWGAQINIAAGATGPTLNVTVQGQLNNNNQTWYLFRATGISRAFPNTNIGGLTQALTGQAGNQQIVVRTGNG